MRRRRKGSLALRKDQADKAWRFRVKERAGWRCEKCGQKPPVLHAHHFISRTYARLRFDARNGVSLCPKCHMFGRDSAHKGGPLFVDWFLSYRSSDYLYLMKPEHRQSLAQNRTEADYLALIEELAPEGEGMSDAA